MPEFQPGLADQSIDVFIQDSSSTTGEGLSGLVYNSSGLKCYFRKGATGTVTQLTLATQTVGGAHSDGGFVELDATNMKGTYRLDLSDTIVASEVDVTLFLYGATNMAPTVVRLNCKLMAADVREVGGTSQTAGDIVALINTLDDYVDTEIASIISTLSTIAGYIDTEVAAIKAKTDNLPSDPADASDITAAFASVTSTLSTIASYIDTEVAAIKAKTDNLPSDPADASDIAASFSTVITDLATIAAYIDTEVAAIKAKTDNLPTDPADASDITSSFSSLSSSLSTLAGYVDTEVAAIKLVTDRLSGMLQLDGLGPLYQFTDDALEQAPAGGGGGGGGTVTGFDSAAIAQLAGLIVSVSPTFSSLRNLQIVSGDDYEDDVQNALTITLSGVLQDLDGATADLYWERGDEQHTWSALSIAETGDDWVFKFERTAAQTATMTVADDWHVALVVTLASSKRVTLARTRSAKVLDAFDD